jgi:Phosphotransferase enzyme family
MEAWLDERLAAAGISRTGDLELVHERPWATVFKASTSAGQVWLKATGPGTAFEAGLYDLLARVSPDHILVPIAVDLERSWILLPDGGRPLGELLEGEALVEAMGSVLPQYAQLQRDLARHAGDLLELGVSDMRAAVMPRRFDEAIEAVEGYLELRGDEDDRRTYERVVEMRGPFETWCDRLADAPVPASLDHNDLHPWNVFVDGTDGRARFYDWGDGVVAHPFSSMLVGLGFVQFRVLDVGVEHPRVERLRDAYLEVFSDLAPRAELLETLELACLVGKVARALTWTRAVTALGWDEVEESWARAPLGAMGALLDDSYLGRF